MTQQQSLTAAVSSSAHLAAEKRIIATVWLQQYLDHRFHDIGVSQGYDVTAGVLSLSAESIQMMVDDTDSTNELVDYAELGHPGPHRVEVVASIRDFFGVGSLSEIDQQMVTSANCVLQADNSTGGHLVRQGSENVPNLLDAVIEAPGGIDGFREVDENGNTVRRYLLEWYEEVPLAEASPDDIVLIALLDDGTSMEMHRGRIPLSEEGLGYVLTKNTWLIPCRLSPVSVDKDHLQAARQFYRELWNSEQSLLEIAEKHGQRTLADLMYLQNAILCGETIDHYPERSAVLEVIRALPSGDRWGRYVAGESTSSKLAD